MSLLVMGCQLFLVPVDIAFKKSHLPIKHVRVETTQWERRVREGGIRRGVSQVGCHVTSVDWWLNSSW